MTHPLTIALDAMGGDNAPAVVVDGVKIALESCPDAHFLVFGDEARISPLIQGSEALRRACEIRHTSEMVSATESPSQALRRNRSSSMGLAIEAVKAGEAAVAVSAGNTGALMAMSKFMLRTMPGISRPALATVLPTARGGCVMLDLGANVECDPDNLVQFAVMGAAFARALLGLKRPKVGLLNVGEEELKGHDIVKKAGQLLKTATLPFEFVGFVEGDAIGRGDADVVVTDGFTGNVSLKTAEGIAHLAFFMLRQAFEHSFLTRIGYLLVKPGLRTMRKKLDPANHNGAVLVGLNGLVVKSHGGASAGAYANAIRVAVSMAAGDLCGRISRDIANVPHIGVVANQVAAS